jgi:hypothetical protein
MCLTEYDTVVKIWFCQKLSVVGMWEFSPNLVPKALFMSQKGYLVSFFLNFFGQPKKIWENVFSDIFWLSEFKSDLGLMPNFFCTITKVCLFWLCLWMHLRPEELERNEMQTLLWLTSWQLHLYEHMQWVIQKISLCITTMCILHF